MGPAGVVVRESTGRGKCAKKETVFFWMRKGVSGYLPWEQKEIEHDRKDQTHLVNHHDQRLEDGKAPCLEYLRIHDRMVVSIGCSIKEGWE